MKITKLHAREILDSRGIPTVEAQVTLADGTIAKGATPSGASTGTHEAVELRDEDPTRHRGKGVLKAVKNINSTIASEVVGKNFATQHDLDDIMIKLDGTPNKATLGGNAILAVSMAFCRACAVSQGLELYQYFQKLSGIQHIETPQLAILIMEGGKHGNWATDFQEFMVIPRRERFATVEESLRAGAEIFWATHDILLEKNYTAAVGFEGAFAPQEIQSNTEAFEIMLAGIEKAGYAPEEEVVLGIDAAASEFCRSGVYDLRREGKKLNTNDWIDLQIQWYDQYPIWSIEDPLDEEDWEGWSKLNSMIGNNLQLVGDDLLTTNTKRIQKAIDLEAANSVLIKINQICTISETFDAIQLADEAGFTTMIAHRAGETNDDMIADMVMGTTSWQSKFGGPDRGERLAKYNRLLEIEQMI